MKLVIAALLGLTQAISLSKIDGQFVMNMQINMVKDDNANALKSEQLVDLTEKPKEKTKEEKEAIVTAALKARQEEKEKMDEKLEQKRFEDQEKKDEEDESHKKERESITKGDVQKIKEEVINKKKTGKLEAEIKEVADGADKAIKDEKNE